MKSSNIASRLGQMFFGLFLLVIVCINNDGLDADQAYTFLKWLPVGLCSAQIPLNIGTISMLAN